MLLEELFEDQHDLLSESARPIWARRGKKIVRKYRCAAGAKKGQIVSDPAQCGRGVDVKKRQTFKKARLMKGKRAMRKAQRTKSRDPISKRIKQLNK